jgi:hypothetical protein
MRITGAAAAGAGGRLLDELLLGRDFDPLLFFALFPLLGFDAIG